MNSREYQLLAARTAAKHLGRERTLIAALGLVGEAIEYGTCHQYQEKQEEAGDVAWYCAELCTCLGIDLGGDEWEEYESFDVIIDAGYVGEHIKKHIGHGHDLDVEYVAWTLRGILSLMAEEVGLEIGEIFEANIAKLRARYPDGFETARSINRVES